MGAFSPDPKAVTDDRVQRHAGIAASAFTVVQYASPLADFVKVGAELTPLHEIQSLLLLLLQPAHSDIRFRCNTTCSFDPSRSFLGWILGGAPRCIVPVRKRYRPPKRQDRTEKQKSRLGRRFQSTLVWVLVCVWSPFSSFREPSLPSCNFVLQYHQYCTVL